MPRNDGKAQNRTTNVPKLLPRLNPASYAGWITVCPSKEMLCDARQ